MVLFGSLLDLFVSVLVRVSMFRHSNLIQFELLNRDFDRWTLWIGTIILSLILVC